MFEPSPCLPPPPDPKQVYIIEANPRASRTVPFVAKAIGHPLAAYASLLMSGKKLSDINFTEVGTARWYLLVRPLRAWCGRVVGLQARAMVPGPFQAPPMIGVRCVQLRRFTLYSPPPTTGRAGAHSEARGRQGGGAAL